MLTAVVAVLAIGTGDYHVPPGQVLAAVFGDAPRSTEIVVMQSRFPRVALAFLFGAALGVSGAIFQSLTRNPLGSPDIIGFTAEHASGEIRVDGQEIAEAAWFTRDRLPRIPPPLSIARRLIDAFVAQVKARTPAG